MSYKFVLFWFVVIVYFVFVDIMFRGEWRGKFGVREGRKFLVGVLKFREM